MGEDSRSCNSIRDVHRQLTGGRHCGPHHLKTWSNMLIVAFRSEVQNTAVGSAISIRRPILDSNAVGEVSDLSDDDNAAKDTTYEDIMVVVRQTALTAEIVGQLIASLDTLLELKSALEVALLLKACATLWECIADPIDNVEKDQIGTCDLVTNEISAPIGIDHAGQVCEKFWQAFLPYVLRLPSSFGLLFLVEFRNGHRMMLLNIAGQ